MEKKHTVSRRTFMKGLSLLAGADSLIRAAPDALGRWIHRPQRGIDQGGSRSAWAAWVWASARYRVRASLPFATSMRTTSKQAMEVGGPDVKGYKDFREVLERPDVDLSTSQRRRIGTVDPDCCCGGRAGMSGAKSR